MIDSRRGRRYSHIGRTVYDRYVCVCWCGDSDIANRWEVGGIYRNLAWYLDRQLLLAVAVNHLLPVALVAAVDLCHLRALLGFCLHLGETAGHAEAGYLYTSPSIHACIVILSDQVDSPSSPCKHCP